MQDFRLSYQDYGHLDAPAVDLAGWDILQDQDLLFGSDLHDVSALPISDAEERGRERLKEKNRLAQKRARQRKKVHVLC